MRFTLLAACLFGFVVFVCPKSIDRTGQVRMNHPNISIINGILARAGDFPFMASVLIPQKLNSPLDFQCGGTLIAPSYILTAAHCLIIGSPKNIKVFINSLDNNGNGTGSIARNVSKFILHPQFVAPINNLYRNDIALLVLNRPVQANANISFVRLPTALMTTTKRPNPTTTTRRLTTRTTRKVITTSPIRTIRTTTRKRAANLRTFSTYSNQPATITGWGITESGSTSATLRKANVTVYDNEFCNNQWNRELDGSIHVCAGQRNIAICLGDSGGPLLVNGNVQIGISSFVSASGCANPTRFSVFTRVSTYIGWIAATMVNNPPPASGK